MTFIAVSRMVGCVAFLAVAATPSFAASNASDAFIANIRLKTSFLAQAGGLAKDHAASEKLRQFAASQKDEQVAILDELDGISASIANNVVAELPQPTIGRSVATDSTTDAVAYEAPAGAGALMPAAAIGLDRLSTMKGEAFDALYVSVNRNVMSDLAAFYQAYGKTGDDPALRAVAARELPRLTAELKTLD